MAASLFEAIEAGDLERVSQGLSDCKAYEDLNRCDDSDETPLMKAAWCKGENRKHILQLLWVKHLQLKGDLEEALSRKDDDGFTVLMHAALSEDEETLKLVLGFYRQVFDDLKFLKHSISSADLPQAEKKNLTKKIGNCLARLPPVKKAPATNTKNNDINNLQSNNANGQSQAATAKDNASHISSFSEDSDDDDDEKSPKLTNTKSQPKPPLQAGGAVPLTSPKDEFYATSSSESSQDGARQKKKNGDLPPPTTIELSGDTRDEILTTLQCMKTLAVPLHDAIRKGKAGPSELAKMESIMMLMGSMQDVLSPDAWQAL